MLPDPGGMSRTYRGKLGSFPSWSDWMKIFPNSFPIVICQSCYSSSAQFWDSGECRIDVRTSTQYYLGGREGEECQEERAVQASHGSEAERNASVRFNSSRYSVLISMFLYIYRLKVLEKEIAENKAHEVVVTSDKEEEVNGLTICCCLFVVDPSTRLQNLHAFALSSFYAPASLSYQKCCAFFDEVCPFSSSVRQLLMLKVKSELRGALEGVGDAEAEVIFSIPDGVQLFTIDVGIVS